MAAGAARPNRSTCRPTSATRRRARHLIDATVERFGRLDILVNNAGWTTLVPHHDLDALTDEIFRKTFEVNVFGTWWLTKAAIPHLRESPDPNVVMITSLAGIRPIGLVDGLRDDEGRAQPPHPAAGQVLRPRAGQRGGARAGRDAVDGRLGRPARGDRRMPHRSTARRPRKTAPKPCSACCATRTSRARSSWSTAALASSCNAFVRHHRFCAQPRPHAGRPCAQKQGGATPGVIAT